MRNILILAAVSIMLAAVTFGQEKPVSKEATITGEVIDVDGPCGGYNLQIAFSTGGGRRSEVWVLENFLPTPGAAK